MVSFGIFQYLYNVLNIDGNHKINVTFGTNRIHIYTDGNIDACISNVLI